MPTLEPLAQAHPSVTVFMAVRNEEAGLAGAARSALDNGYAPVTLVIAVGPSTDATHEIAERLAADERVTVVDNAAGTTPHGLNAALAAATGDVWVRMDGHGELPPGYIATAVEALRQTGAANVGGRMVPDAEEPFARAVAVAMKSRFGIGGAGHRIGGEAGEADSVFLGSFRREAVEAVGGYDEHFLRAQDWELNRRLRAAGYLVWFDPAMEVAYAPRRSWKALARQFHESGRWRREVVRRHRGTASARYLVPPAVVFATVAGTLVGVAGLASSISWLLLGFAAPLGYLAGVLVATVLLAGAAGWRGTVRMPVVLSTMHMAWGAGFLRGVG